MTKDDAIFTIAAYREDHKITPVARFDRTGSYCAHDGLPLDPRKGGFRHSQSAIFRAQDIAGYVPVDRCSHRYIPGGEACNLTLAYHLRQKRIEDLARENGRSIPTIHPFAEKPL